MAQRSDPQAILAVPPGQVQVAPQHYVFERYDDRERWCSYWHQIRQALRLSPRTVLEIGSGTGVFKSYLRSVGITVHGLDIDATRGPELVGSVEALDSVLPPGARYDVVAAFQVLEHLPFEEFETCLQKLAAAGEHVLISLPRHGWMLRVQWALFGWRVSWGFQLPYPWRMKRQEQPEHFWELGVGWSIKRVTRLMAKYFDVLERGHVPENPYHYMWVLRSRVAAGQAR